VHVRVCILCVCITSHKERAVGEGRKRGDRKEREIPGSTRKAIR